MKIMAKKISPEMKLEVIKRAENGEQIPHLAKEYNLGNSNWASLNRVTS